MVFVKKFLVLLFIVFISYQANAKVTTTIVAMVNDEIISSLDVKERMELIKNTGLSHLSVRELEDRALQILVEEKLFFQEAKKYKISVDERDIKKAIESIEKQNNMEKGYISKLIKEKHLSENSFKDQVKGQIIWNKLMGYKVSPKVVISEKDIEQENAIINKNPYEVEIKQIIIPIVNIQNQLQFDNKMLELQEVRNTLTCNNFSQIARKVGSVANLDSLKIPSDNLTKEHKTMVDSMNIGDVSPVINTKDMMQLFVVCDKDYKFVIRPSDEEIRNAIFQRKLSLQASYYLRDLKQKAHIVYKDKE